MLESIVEPASSQATDASEQSEPVILIDTAELPDGGELRLLRRGGDYSIRFGREELMGSQVWNSEQALATLASARMADPEGRMLIGGLGMGFTLGAALAALPPRASVIVAELVPQVLAWAKGPLAHLFGDHLADPRVAIEMADVHDVIVRASKAEDSARYDAILLDVDNGPDGLIHLANERLYCNWGLRAAYAALRPGGLLAVWSAHPDDAFRGRLERAGFAVDEVKVEAEAGEDSILHTLWFATRAG